jgi:lactoylglutathione lyase
MAPHLVHTCVRVRDLQASLRFYEALGFERRGRLNFETAFNVYLGLPGDGDKLELTVNDGREEPYDLGDGYNHVALVVDDLAQTLAHLKAALGVDPEKPAFHPGGREELPLIAFVEDPDGYRIELIDGAFPTPQDPDDR